MRIEHTSSMPEPAWSTLVSQSLLQRTGYLDSTARIPEDRRARVDARRAAAREGRRLHCFTAWRGDLFLGGTLAHEARPGVLYAKQSVVAPEYRRQGVYSALTRHLIDWARAEAFVEITSLHVATNNPVLIAKLSLGFQLSGMRIDPEFGTLVELALPLEPSRDALRRYRSGERPEPPPVT